MTSSNTVNRPMLPAWQAQDSQKPEYQTDALATQTSGKVVNSADLFDGQRMLTIEHNESTYLLRITRENKLILTK